MRHDTKDFYKKLMLLVVPIAFQNLMLALVGATDAFLLGMVDQNSMAAVSLATQIDFILNLFLMAVVTGTTALAAQYYGKGDIQTVQKLFCLAIRYAGLISFVFFLLAFCCPQQLMKIYTSDPELIEIGAGYLKIVSWSYLFSGITKCYLCMMKISERTVKCAVISVAAVIVDVVMDIFFIFGVWGFPKMGANGSAVSTVIVFALQLVWVIAESLKKGHLHPTWRGLIKILPWLEKDFWKIAVPSLINNLIWGVGFSLYSAIMGHLGSDATAANSIAAVMKELISCLCMGLGGGAEIIIGHALGQNQLERAKEYGAKLSRFAILCGVVSGVLLALLSPLLLEVVVLSAAAQRYLQQMLVICAVYLFAKSLNVTVVCGIFAAGGDIKYDAVSTAISMWLFSIPLGLLAAFVFKWPVIWVYLIVSADEIIKIPWMYPRYKKYIWLKNLTKEQ